MLASYGTAIKMNVGESGMNVIYLFPEIIASLLPAAVLWISGVGEYEGQVG